VESNEGGIGAGGNRQDAAARGLRGSSEGRETRNRAPMGSRKNLALPSPSATTAPTVSDAQRENLRQHLLELILKSERNCRRLNLALLRSSTPAADPHRAPPA
jgi:hypothetical protein